MVKSVSESPIIENVNSLCLSSSSDFLRAFTYHHWERILIAFLRYEIGICVVYLYRALCCASPHQREYGAYTRWRIEKNDESTGGGTRRWFFHRSMRHDFTSSTYLRIHKPWRCQLSNSNSCNEDGSRYSWDGTTVDTIRSSQMYYTKRDDECQWPPKRRLILRGSPSRGYQRSKAGFFAIQSVPMGLDVWKNK